MNDKSETDKLFLVEFLQRAADVILEKKQCTHITPIFIWFWSFTMS